MTQDMRTYFRLTDVGDLLKSLSAFVVVAFIAFLHSYVNHGLLILLEFLAMHVSVSVNF